MIYKSTTIFLLKKYEELKVPYNFSAKNISAVDFVSTVRLNKSSSNDFVKGPIHVVLSV